jgi:hypothetical protein
MTITELDNIDKLDLFETLTDPDSEFFSDDEWITLYDPEWDDNGEIIETPPFEKIKLIDQWLKIKFNNNLMKLYSYMEWN